MAKEIKNLAKRNAQEARFKFFGRASIGFALLFLVMLFGMILTKSNGAFTRSEIALNVDLTAENLDHRQIIKDALKARFVDASSVAEINSLYQLASKVANLELKKQLEKHPELVGQKTTLWFSASSKVDMFMKHNDASTLSENQLKWIADLQEKNEIKK